MSDPSADATATQTWSVLDEADLDGEWIPRQDSEWTGPHPGGEWVGPRPGGDSPPAAPAHPASIGSPTALVDGGPVQPRPGGRLAARRDRQAAEQEAAPSWPAGANPGPGRVTGSRSAARGRTPDRSRTTRKPASRARMWLMPLVMMVIVAVVVAFAYLRFVKGRVTAAGNTPSRTPATASSPSPSLGPWKHITTRAEDPAPLSLAELFPARYSAGGANVLRTAEQARPNCVRMLLGAKLQAAVRRAGCTQVLRASYLSPRQKIMATIGVLNLADVGGAQRAGQATGATAFIKQLPGPKGPTRQLNQGTGLEEAQIKGHYLILTWAEFTSLKAPANAGQRAKLDVFSRGLVGGTANISLTSRMLFGKRQTP